MSKKKLLDAARTSFKKIMEIAEDLRKGKKDRRATPPVGGDGREHNRRIGTPKSKGRKKDKGELYYPTTDDAGFPK